jgi:prepilin-type N-terminal cleavage/methylation domain-containing protein
MRNLHKKAFSLIELSIVILIIGIIIAGITQSSRLIAQFKLSSARTQTESSPVPSISGLISWHETTLERSFSEGETEDHELDSTAPGVLTWFDLNPTDSTRRNAVASVSNARPFYYARCINGLPCIRFDGTDDVLSFASGALNPLIGNNYTIFAVVQRTSAADANHFLGKSTAASVANSIALGYNGSTTVTFSQGDSETVYYTAPVGAFSSSLRDPHLHSFVNAYLVSTATPPIFHYLDGSATQSTLTGTGGPAFIKPLGVPDSIGANNNGTTLQYFTGDIGELIIYNRVLKIEERRAVEAYLLKKWLI